MLKRLKAIWQLSRADHALITILAIFVSYYYLTHSWSIPWYVWLIPALLQLSVFIFNDILDYNTDKSNNRTDRPLVIGDISIKDAKIIGILFVLIGLLLGLWLLDLYLMAFVVSVTILSFLYNYKFKDMPFVGNVIVAFTMVAPFIYVMLFVNKLDSFLLMFSYAILFFGISREIIKSIEDMRGDAEARNAKTLPIVLGLKGAKEIAMVFWIIYLVFLAYLILISPSNLLLLILFMIGIYIAKKIWDLKSPQDATYLKKIMFYMMLLGVLVLVFPF